MMSRAEVRRSLLATGVDPSVVESIVADLPVEAAVPRGLSPRALAPHADEADRAGAQVLADFERLLGDDDPS
ncbi:MAG: hypothetical protein JRG82_08975 [Deltaproteobacteria bacterium]|nr:hypothetical protein [Deltaproteobacteria bacterium]